MTTIYACTGTCHGVSMAKKNCGAEECNMFNEPLEARMQCEACHQKTNQDYKAHTCDNCKKV